MEFLSEGHVHLKILKYVLIYTLCSSFYLQPLVMNETEHLCTSLKPFIFPFLLTVYIF